MYEIRIPKSRIAVLIGEKGATKMFIEKNTDTKLKIDSEDGDVIISSEDNLKAFNAQDVVKAIGRGFNPEIALKLTKEGNVLEIVDMDDFAKTKNHLLRVKARVIGKEGKSRKFIESTTNTHICVYGKTVSIIGKVEDVTIARKAIEKLLSGAPHGHAFNFIEKSIKELKTDLE